MLCPFVRASATTCRISSIVSTSCILEAVLCIGIGAVSNVTRPRSNGDANFTSHLGVALQELWLEGVVETENVRQNEDLSVTVGAGADANRWYPDSRGDTLGHGSWYKLENDGESARLLEAVRFGHESLRALGLATLNTSAADGVDGLRREADVPHHRNAGPHQRVHRVEHLGAATLDLHGTRSRLLNRASAVQHRTLDARLIGKERHIDDDERALHSTPNRCCMADPVIDRDRQRRWISHDRGPYGIANQNRVDPGLVDEPSEERIVGGHHYQLLAFSFALGEIADSDWTLLGLAFIQLARSSVRPAPGARSRDWI